MKPVYLDNHATTPMDPRVFEAMKPYFLEDFGNAASRNHQFGWRAEKAVENARKQIASLINCSEKEIIFTSGATESDNMAILGIAEMYAEKGDHIITTNIEHKAILDSCKVAEKRGFKVTYLPVDKYGQVTVESVRAALTDKTILISVMFANNEIGSINPIGAVGALAKEKGIIFHTDAVQALGRVPVDVEALGIDLLSISGHKIYGPKGVGALYVRRKNPRVKLSPLIHGGGHERGMRSGTLNVPGIVGLGKASELAKNELAQDVEKQKALRDRLEKKLFDALDEIHLNGHPTERLPNNLNISFAFVEGESLMMGIKDIAVSSGSACTTASLEPSYVLRAIGVTEDLAHTSIRFGLGRFTTPEEVDYTAEQVIKTVRRLREMSPLYEMAKEGVDLKNVNWATH
jgi:cysteine desulfurase